VALDEIECDTDALGVAEALTDGDGDGLGVEDGLTLAEAVRDCEALGEIPVCWKTSRLTKLPSRRFLRRGSSTWKRRLTSSGEIAWPLGDGDALIDADGVALCEALGVAEALTLADGVWLAETLAEGVWLALTEADGVALGVLDGLTEAEAVRLCDALGVAEALVDGDPPGPRRP
jgi:hypothetical protein